MKTCHRSYTSQAFHNKQQGGYFFVNIFSRHTQDPENTDLFVKGSSGPQMLLQRVSTRTALFWGINDNVDAQRLWLTQQEKPVKSRKGLVLFENVCDYNRSYSTKQNIILTNERRKVAAYIISEQTQHVVKNGKQVISDPSHLSLFVLTALHFNILALIILCCTKTADINLCQTWLEQVEMSGFSTSSNWEMRS